MKSARTDAPADDEIPRFDSVSPPGESVHESQTKVGDLSAALAEAVRAAVGEEKATAKMGSFELAAVLQKQREAEDRDEATSGARLRTASPSSDAAPARAPADEPVVAPAPEAPTLSRARGFVLLAAALLFLALGSAAVIASSSARAREARARSLQAP